MLDAVFTYAETAPLSVDDEIAAISQAQQGDDDATLRLLIAYGPALRSAVGRFTSQGEHALPVEDLQAEALAAFIETLADHDPEVSPRLAGPLPGRLSRALGDYVASLTPFRVPDRTLSRFYGILRAADGDVETALTSAPDHGMSPEVFAQVLAAVRAESLDDTTAEAAEGTGRQAVEVSSSPVFAPSPVVDVEDKILVDLAFRAVTDEEARICELAYGFTEYDPVPDPEIAHRMGLTKPTVQRKRTKALGKMREALGVSHAGKEA